MNSTMTASFSEKAHVYSSINLLFMKKNSQAFLKAPKTFSSQQTRENSYPIPCNNVIKKYMFLNSSLFDFNKANKPVLSKYSINSLTLDVIIVTF